MCYNTHYKTVFMVVVMQVL